MSMNSYHPYVGASPTSCRSKPKSGPVYFHPKDPRAGVVADAFQVAESVAQPYKRAQVREAASMWWRSVKQDRNASPDDVVLAAVTAGMDQGVKEEVIQGLVGMNLVQGDGGTPTEIPKGRIVGITKMRPRTKRIMGAGALLLVLFLVGGSAWVLANLPEPQDVM